jgi:mannose-6-phosphate isomerase-like protein (cupin superfamily)
VRDLERVNENDIQYRGGDSGPKYLFRGPHMEWGVLRLKPGDELGAHYHNEIEETFYFPKGKVEMIIDGVSYRVADGDAFKIGAGEVHNIKNDTECPIKFIFMKAPYNPEDKVSV